MRSAKRARHGGRKGLTTLAAEQAQPVREDPNVIRNRLIFGFGGMLIGQFLAYLDIQVVNSSLAQIQAGTSASSDEISWVQSAYLIAEVVMIPLSSYLARWWGTQRLFMISCTGFVIMSVLTGLSSDIDTMILTRALRQLRAARGLVQEDMLLATSRRHISRIEQGHQIPSVRTIEVLAEQMQVHPLTLVALAYCPELDAASVSELLKTLKSDFKGLVAD